MTHPLRRLRRPLPGLLLAILCLSSGGCVTATVQAVREANTGMEATDSIGVLGRRSRPNSNETEFNFVNCVNRKVSSGSNSIQVVNEQNFRDALFPWFEPRTAPGKASDLSELLSQSFGHGVHGPFGCRVE